MSETLATDKSPQETDHADGQIFLLWTVIQLYQSRRWWINLTDSQSLNRICRRSTLNSRHWNQFFCTFFLTIYWCFVGPLDMGLSWRGSHPLGTVWKLAALQWQLTLFLPRIHSANHDCTLESVVDSVYNIYHHIYTEVSASSFCCCCLFAQYKQTKTACPQDCDSVQKISKQVVQVINSTTVQCPLWIVARYFGSTVGLLFKLGVYIFLYRLRCARIRSMYIEYEL